MDSGMFVLLDSDIDEDEYGFISKKLKALHKKKSRKLSRAKRKSSSLSSSPTPSEASFQQDSDDTSTCLSVNNNVNGPSSPQTARVGQQHQLKRRKLQETNSKSPKMLRTEYSFKSSIHLKSDIFCSDSVNEKTAQTKMKRSTTCPGSLQSINTTHDYAFSGFQDIGSRRTTTDESAVEESSLRWKAASQSHSTKNSDLTSDSVGILERVSNLKPQSHSQSWCKSQRALSRDSQRTVASCRSASCLTNCKSCAEYTLPVLSETDNSEMTSYVALDCEFVGVGPTKTSALGRCSIVDHRGVVLFDRFVKPAEPVTDYRTPWSGLRPRNIRQGIPFMAAQEQIAEIIKEKIVVGHAIHNDFRVMRVSHPLNKIRDTSGCKLLREMADLPGSACALRKLTEALLGRIIQKREHCSVTDARACMDLFRLVRTSWEPILLAKVRRRESRQQVQESAATEKPPGLTSFLDDQYWPAGMFAD